MFNEDLKILSSRLSMTCAREFSRYFINGVYGKKYTIWVEKSIRWLSGIKYTVGSGRKYTICDSSGKRYTIPVEKQLRFLT